MTLNDPYPLFQSRAILWCWITQKRYYIHTQFQWNTDRNLHALLDSVVSNYLEWLSKIFNDKKSARFLCDSWAFCKTTQSLIFLLQNTRSGHWSSIFRSWFSGPAFSGPAFFTPDIWSCIFSPAFFVLSSFLVLHFVSCIFSRPMM